MIWVHLVGLLFFVTSKWMDVHVVYQEVCLAGAPLLKGVLTHRHSLLSVKPLLLDLGNYGPRASKRHIEFRRTS